MYLRGNVKGIDNTNNDLSRGHKAFIIASFISLCQFMHTYTKAVSPKKQGSQDKAHNYHIHSHLHHSLSPLAPDREEKSTSAPPVYGDQPHSFNSGSFIASFLSYHTQLYHNYVRLLMFGASLRSCRVSSFLMHSQLSTCFCHAQSFYCALVSILFPKRPPQHHPSIPYVAYVTSSHPSQV